MPSHRRKYDTFLKIYYNCYVPRERIPIKKVQDEKIRKESIRNT